MEMFLTVMSHLHVLIHRLAPLLCHIFHDSSLFGKFIQVTVNRCDVHLVIVFFQILVNVRHRHCAVAVCHEIF